MGHGQVLVGVDYSWHNRFSGEIHVSGAGGNFKLAFSADGGKAAVPNDENGIVDSGAAIAGDEPGAFKHGEGRRLLRLDDER